MPKQVTGYIVEVETSKGWEQVLDTTGILMAYDRFRYEIQKSKAAIMEETYNVRITFEIEVLEQ